jgi:hypothetical protein
LEELAGELQRLGAPRGPEIDLRVLNGAGPRFWANLLTNSRVLYQADRVRRLEQEAMAMSRWLDFAPIWRRMRLRMLERWTNG